MQDAIAHAADQALHLWLEVHSMTKLTVFAMRHEADKVVDYQVQHLEAVLQH